MSYYYNVIISESEEYNSFTNQLVFTFYNLDETMRFIEDILEISDYEIKILKLEDTGDE